MKKVLILTVTAGGGHNSAAKAMKEYLENRGCEVQVTDMFKEFAPRLTRWTVDRGYGIAVSHFRRIYNAAYGRYLDFTDEKALKSPEQRVVKRVHGGLLKLIYSYRPDVIYATSFHCAVAIANLKRAYPIPAKVVTAMLDYVVSPFWECAAEGVDKIATPDKVFYDGLVCKGFNLMQIEPAGIPVKECRVPSKRTFKDDRFTILIMFGGGYWGGAYSAFKALLKGVKKPVRIVVVNGCDKKTKGRIDKKIKRLPPHIEVINMGFADNVPAIMAECNVMVGKGGGLTVTESVNCRLPLIATAKLAGQEYYNVEYLLSRGAAEKYKNRRELVKLINAYMDEPDRVEKVRAKLALLGGNGLEKVARIIEQFPESDYGGIGAEPDYKRVNREVKRARLNAYKRVKFEQKYEKYKGD